MSLEIDVDGTTYHLTHTGRVAREHSAVWEVRTYLRGLSDSPPPLVEAGGVRGLHVDTGARDASENAVFYDGALELDFVTTEPESFELLSEAGEYEVLFDLAEAPDPELLGTEDEEIVWSGYLMPDFSSRVLGKHQHVVGLEARTGLRSLKNKTFDPLANALELLRLDGKMRVIDGIAYCLSFLRGGLDLYSSSALYATMQGGTEGAASMDASDPLGQLYFDAARLYTDLDEIQIFESGTVIDDGDGGMIGVIGGLPGGPDLVGPTGRGTDCLKALTALLGDVEEKAGLHSLFPSRVAGRAAWSLRQRVLCAEPGGYERTRYSITEGRGVESVGTDVYDPDVIEGEGEHFEYWLDESRPSVESLRSIRYAAARYEHELVPSYLSNHDFLLWRYLDSIPVDWEMVFASNTIEPYVRRVEIEEDVQKAGAYGLAMTAASPGYFTTPPQHSTIIGLTHLKAQTQQVEAGDLFKLSGRLYPAMAEDLNRPREHVIGVPFGVTFEGEDGLTYYLDDSTGSVGGGTVRRTREWIEGDAPLGDGVVLYANGDGFHEDSTMLPPFPVDGVLTLYIPRPYRSNSVDEVIYDYVRLDLVDGEGERVDGRRVQAYVSQAESGERDDAVMYFADGPAPHALGALYAENADGDLLPTEFWRQGYDSEPEENGGAGLPLYEMHARQLARQRARGRSVRSGTIGWMPDEAAWIGFDSVLVTPHGRLTAVSRRWYPATGQVEGRWVEVATRPQTGDYSIDALYDVSQGARGSLPPANNVAGSISRVNDEVGAVSEQALAAISRLAVANALTVLSDDVPAGGLDTLAVAEIEEALLREGGRVVVVDAATGRQALMQLTADQEAGATSLQVEDPEEAGSAVTLEEGFGAGSGVFFASRDDLLATRELQREQGLDTELRKLLLTGEYDAETSTIEYDARTALFDLDADPSARPNPRS